MSDEPRALGVDYGGRRIGLAVSDPTRTIAQGLATLHATGLRDAVRKVAAEAAKWQVSEIVVGLPLTLGGVSGEAARAATAFARALARATGIAVAMADERFTSVIAQRALHAMGGRTQKEDVDRLSATMILQTVLDSPALAHPLDPTPGERDDDHGGRRT